MGILLFLWLLPSTVATPSEVYKRIVQGRPCRHNEARYHVGLCQSPCNLKHHVFCGGSLISVKWVLTSAHCDDRVQTDLSVVLGTHDLVDPHTWKVIKGKKLKHENYDSKTQDFDIMLVELEEAVTPSHTAEVVKLPTGCSADGEPPVELQCLLSGWGVYGWTVPSKDVQSKPLFPDHLDCLDTHRADCPEKEDTILPVTPNKFCAGGHGDSFNCGDFGGGLVCGNKELYGVASSFRAPPTSQPAKFTKVCNFLDWIKEHVSELKEN